MTDPNRSANLHEELERGRLAAREVEALSQASLWAAAVSRAYYGMFHLARALAFSLGVEVRTHSGLITVLSAQLVKPGHFPADKLRQLTQMQRLREEADYHTTAMFDEAAAQEAASRLCEFQAAVEQYLAAHGWI